MSRATGRDPESRREEERGGRVGTPGLQSRAPADYTPSEVRAGSRHRASPRLESADDRLRGAPQREDRRRLRRLPHRHAHQPPAARALLVAGVHGHAEDGQGTRAGPGFGLPGRVAGSVEHGAVARPVLAVVRATRAVRARPARRRTCRRGDASTSWCETTATSGSGTRHTECARASTRRSTATCRASAWPAPPSTGRSAPRARQRAGSANDRTTSRRCLATRPSSRARWR